MAAEARHLLIEMTDRGGIGFGDDEHGGEHGDAGDGRQARLLRAYPARAGASRNGGLMDGLEKWWAIGLLPAVWLAWWLWWKLPKREVAKLRHSIRNPKDREDVEDTLRKTIGQALGAVAVLVGAGFALAQFLEQRETARSRSRCPRNR